MDSGSSGPLAAQEQHTQQHGQEQQHQQDADGAYFLPPLDHPLHAEQHAHDDVDALIHSALEAYTGGAAAHGGAGAAAAGGTGAGPGPQGADHLALVRAATLGQQQQQHGGATGTHAGAGATTADGRDADRFPTLPMPPSAAAAPAAAPPPPPAPAAPVPAPVAPTASDPPRPGRGPGSRARWTAQEDAHLVALVRVVPPLTWNEIGEAMARPPTGCSMRWYKFLREKVAQGEMEEPGPQAANNAAAAPSSGENGGELRTSDAMVVGGSGGDGANAQVQSQNGEQALQVQDGSDAGSSASPSAPGAAIKRGGRKAVATLASGRLVPLESVPPSALPPALPPSETLPGHPYPLKEGLKLHSNAGRGYLPQDAMVAHPPVPFQPHTVLRGRRTQAAAPLPAAASPSGGEEGSASPDVVAAPLPAGKKGGKGSKGGLSKASASVHKCPAENCKAAFKRSEHLRRHYKSVHRGEKPFPCTVAGCGKTFSRKDNLQQHQAMVHLVRALYTYPDGTTSTDPPEAGTPAAEGVTVAFAEVDVVRPQRKDGTPAAGAGAKVKKGEGEESPAPQSQAQQQQQQQGQGLRGVVPAAANYSVAPSASPSVEGADGEAGGEGATGERGEKRARRSGTAEGDEGADDAGGRIDKRLRLTGLGGAHGAEQLDPALRVLAAQAASGSGTGGSGGEGGAPARDGAGARSITPSQAFAVPGLTAAAPAPGAQAQARAQAQAQYYAALAAQLQRRGSAGAGASEGDMLVDADADADADGLGGLRPEMYVPGLEAFLSGHVDVHHGHGGASGEEGEEGGRMG
ncbi:CRISPR system Cascade subunit CasD [Rhodotorula kratochvilovae]